LDNYFNGFSVGSDAWKIKGNRLIAFYLQSNFTPENRTFAPIHYNSFTQ